jgi:hypothetical protein
MMALFCLPGLAQTLPFSVYVYVRVYRWDSHNIFRTYVIHAYEHVACICVWVSVCMYAYTPVQLDLCTAIALLDRMICRQLYALQVREIRHFRVSTTAHQMWGMHQPAYVCVYVCMYILESPGLLCHFEVLNELQSDLCPSPGAPPSEARIHMFYVCMFGYVSVCFCIVIHAHIHMHSSHVCRAEYSSVYVYIGIRRYTMALNSCFLPMYVLHVYIFTHTNIYDLEVVFPTYMCALYAHMYTQIYIHH